MYGGPREEDRNVGAGLEQDINELYGGGEDNQDEQNEEDDQSEDEAEDDSES
jgi:hypothetical protein